jgi:hypothetical protein
MTPKAFHALFGRIGARAKIPFPIHPHILRHGCGYALANAGHDTRALQAWLGNKNIQHTVRYTELAPDRFTPQIKREFKRRAAIEPVIGHLKEHHRMGRIYLAHASGDAINAVLAAAGYNFRRLLAWLRLLLLRILIAFSLTTQLKSV